MTTTTTRLMQPYVLRRLVYAVTGAVVVVALSLGADPDHVATVEAALDQIIPSLVAVMATMATMKANAGSDGVAAPDTDEDDLPERPSIAIGFHDEHEHERTSSGFDW